MRADDDEPRLSPVGSTAFSELVARRLGRREALAGIAASAALAAADPFRVSSALAGGTGLTFAEVPHGLDDTLHVPPGYRAETLIRWGDPVLTGAAAFDVASQTAGSQRGQFGYNNDFVAFFPLPAGSDRPNHGLLCVNHEYTTARMMFPDAQPDRARVEMAAHGLTVIEVRKRGNRWRVVGPSRFARRITPLDTPIFIGGPAAGHARLQTSADPEGRTVMGTIANCSGGVTPWGTVLTAEENFRWYFSGDPAKSDEARNHLRHGLGRAAYGWHAHHPRFDLEKEPHEPNRFGWIVEIDPHDPASRPVKRTALGRFAHETATVAVDPDGRIVVYSGDDREFEYLYKFVSRRRWNPDDRAANATLLDDGTLHAASFAPDGTLVWLPLVHGESGLTTANGFRDQADVLIEARRAADLLGATPMDRPEGVAVHPGTGAVYVSLTKNKKRETNSVDAANPRWPNLHGHVLELRVPYDGEGRPVHSAARFGWDVFVLAGNPSTPEAGARYHPKTSADGWFSRPDNCVFDARGRLWIATDGAEGAGVADGLWAMETTGADRALSRRFLRAPRGAEVTGPCFTPDNRTLFVAIQHPGHGRGATFAAPGTRWPDFRPDMPPRPSVVAITRDDGGVIGR